MHALLCVNGSSETSHAQKNSGCLFSKFTSLIRGYRKRTTFEQVCFVGRRSPLRGSQTRSHRQRDFVL